MRRSIRWLIGLLFMLALVLVGLQAWGGMDLGLGLGIGARTSGPPISQSNWTLNSTANVTLNSGATATLHN